MLASGFLSCPLCLFGAGKSLLFDKGIGSFGFW
jgi:hypothetical protein